MCPVGVAGLRVRDMPIGVRRWAALAAALVAGGPIGCIMLSLPNEGCGAPFPEPGAYSVDLLGRVGSDAGGACLPDLDVGTQFVFDVDDVGGCGGGARLRSQPEVFAAFVLDERRPPVPGRFRRYTASMGDGCFGEWELSLILPPRAESVGVPCDDCVAITRVFTSRSCPSVPQMCGDTFYGRLVALR